MPHGHDQQQYERHHGLFDADGAKIVRVVLCPVDHLESLRQSRSQAVGDRGRLQRIAISDPQALIGPSRRTESAYVVYVGEKERAVMVRTGLEYPCDLELPQP